MALGASDEMKEHLARTGFLTDAADWFLPGLARFTPGSRCFIAALASGAVSLEVYKCFAGVELGLFVLFVWSVETILICAIYLVSFPRCSVDIRLSSRTWMSLRCK